MGFDLSKFDVAKYHAVLDHGLSCGLGTPIPGNMCIEAAICYSLGLPHSDDPGCVAPAVRCYKIQLNDCLWSSEHARAEGLRKLGLAQLGSAGVVDDVEFSCRLATLIVQRLIPELFRELFQSSPPQVSAAIATCEQAETPAEAAEAARVAAARAVGWAAQRAAEAAEAARVAAARAAARVAEAGWAAEAVRAAQRAARVEAGVAGRPDRYLVMGANIALAVLSGMGSPGVALTEGRR